MVQAIKFRERAAVTLLLLLFPFTSTAIAQESSLPPVPQTSPIPSPDLPPPLLPQQQKAVEQLIQQQVGTNQTSEKEIDDRVQKEVDRTFGWTITLLNLLITVLIAIPIVAGLAALFLRRSVIEQLTREVRSQFELEREQLKVQAAIELKAQLDTFKQELATSKSDFIHQLQDLFSAAQIEKERIFQELARITPSVIQQEFVAPEIQQQIKTLTDQLEVLRSNHSPLQLTAREYRKQGDALYFERRYEEAIKSYDQALDQNPDSVEAWLGKAKILRKLKRYEEAIAANERAIQLQPENPSGWFGKGYTLSDLQKYAESVPCYEQAIQLDPNRHTYWKHKGYVLTKLGHYDEAWACLEKALEINPYSGSTLYWKAYYFAAQNQLDSALDHLQKAIERVPNLQEILKNDADFDALRETDRLKYLMNATA